MSVSLVARQHGVGASQRLLATGKPKMLVVGACMRKLIHIIFGVLKSGMPFNLKSGKCS